MSNYSGVIEIKEVSSVDGVGKQSTQKKLGNSVHSHVLFNL